MCSYWIATCTVPVTLAVGTLRVSCRGHAHGNQYSTGFGDEGEHIILLILYTIESFILFI